MFRFLVRNTVQQPSTKISFLGRSTTTRRYFSSTRCVFGKVISFPLADIGEGITEVQVNSWEVKEGDTVAEFDPLCEVQSDKATADIPTKYAGLIKKLYYAEGDTAKVGSPLVDIELEDDAAAPDEAPAQAPASTPAPSTPTPAAPTPTTTAAPTQPAATSATSEEVAATNSKVPMVPAVRRIARENNIDVSKVTATGKGGRVTKTDILNYIEQGGAAAAPTTTDAAPAAAAPAAAVAPPTQSSFEGDTTVEIKGVAKAMVKSMTQSLAVPTFSCGDEFELNGLVDLRARLKAQLAKIAAQTGKEAPKLTYMPFFIKACSVAMQKYPVVNASVNPAATHVTYHASHNIGVAMDTPAGLLVPNIKNVQNKSILEIAEELTEMSRLGRENKLGPEYFKDGTFALSNIGTIGSTYVMPIPNPPNAAIGAMGKLQKVPRFDAEDNVVPVWTMAVTWTADHRIIDGATMARFSNEVARLLAEPDLFLVSMR
eukprot:TRINITY_DN67306_c3_g3_i1.p1 TRINITY_DN67306_c3_g3~~TRINITY_DN67306_c3_g3_i1.p1  ORF type:complete len:486 (+),score=95.11 TRINITY_DN67306_c3_g3_i1:173-1630(+)